MTVPLTLVPQSRYALRHADHVLVPSESEDAYIGEELCVPPARRTRVDPGVGAAYFDLPRPAYDGRRLRVLFVGTWIDRKGTTELVESWTRLAARYPEMRLTLSCTVHGPDEVLAGFNGHRDRVSVQPLASEQELMRLLSRHHVFVLPAWFEGGMPLAALQAAAAGLPCIVTRIGGHVELFRPADPEADGGLLVPPHDPDAIEAALARLADDPELVRHLGANARDRARSYTWHATAAACLSAYSHATGATGT